MTGKTALLIGTRKGAWVLEKHETQNTWQLIGPTHLGSVVSHIVADPRKPAYQLMSVGSGHLGPFVFMSNDAGASWAEAKTPPAFSPVATEQGDGHG